MGVVCSIEETSGSGTWQVPVVHRASKLASGTLCSNIPWIVGTLGTRGGGGGGGGGGRTLYSSTYP